MKTQHSIQVPHFATKAAERLARKHDEKKKHILGAAVTGFEKLPTEVQAELIAEARRQYAAQGDGEDGGDGATVRRCGPVADESTTDGGE